MIKKIFARQERLRDGQRMSRKKLERMGWKEVHDFYDLVLFKKGVNYLYFDSEENRIDQVLYQEV